MGRKRRTNDVCRGCLHTQRMFEHKKGHTYSIFGKMAQEASDVTANRQKAKEGRFTVKWRPGGDPNTRADQKHDVLGSSFLLAKS